MTHINHTSYYIPPPPGPPLPEEKVTSPSMDYLPGSASLVYVDHTNSRIKITDLTGNYHATLVENITSVNSILLRPLQGLVKVDVAYITFSG